MRLEVSGIDHDGLVISGFRRQPFHDLSKHAHVAPPFPAIVERLGRAIFRWCIAPTQAIAIDEDNATQNTPIIDAWLAMALRKIWPEPCRLLVSQPEKIAHHAP